MNVTQIYQIINTINKEVLGETAVVLEDLSNIVDIGTAVFDSNQTDNYVKSLVDKVGRMVFVDRPYRGGIPSIMMDQWEYGSVMQKVTCKMPEAVENKSWSLENGVTYDTDVFYQPTVENQFWNSKTTFEVNISFTDMQVKSAFNSAQEMNSFMSMIYNAIDKSLTVKIEALAQRVINNMICEVLNANIPDGAWGSNTTVQAVNLLKLYNAGKTDKLTSAEAIYNPDFLRYSSYMINTISDRMTRISTLFNTNKTDKFSFKEDQRFVALADYRNAVNTYLQADVRNNELTKLMDGETVPYWQGSGTAYGLTDISTIHCKIKTSDGTKDVQTPSILGIIFDRDAIGITNTSRRITSNYNAKAEFTTNYYKYDASYFNDLNENFVVFYIADEAAA